jgi:hypothetical protein
LTWTAPKPDPRQAEVSAWNGHFGCTCYHPADRVQPLRRPGALPVAARQCPQRRGLALSAGAGGRPLPRARRRSLSPRRCRVRQARLLEAEVIRYATRRGAAPVARAGHNLANFLRTLALPPEVEHWSLTTLREKLVKVGARVVRHGRYVVVQLAEVVVPRALFAEVFRRIAWLRPRPFPT